MLSLALVTGLQGWGYEAHRLINRTAATILPEALGIYARDMADTLAAHAPDPDVWRKTNPEEGYRHYIDVDYYSQYPFADIPRDYVRAVETYGEESLKNWGTSPWNINLFCDSLSTLMRRGQWEKVPVIMAALGHYIADLHMPLHTVSNYNGQKTGNKGIHYRWEAQLVKRSITGITAFDTVRPAPALPDTNFAIIRESFSAHTRLLAADSKARKGLTAEEIDILAGYDDGPFIDRYLTILQNETGELLQVRLNQAAYRVALYWYNCWLNADRPTPPVTAHD
ncbi:MAG: S1/P1 nuclease [Fidelibacterota bacterium]